MGLEDIDHILTTTRSVRKRLDLERPVEPDVIEQCLGIASQAPTGSNVPQNFFLVVSDSDRRLRLANIYRKAFDEMFQDENLENLLGIVNVELWFFEYFVESYLAKHTMDSRLGTSRRVL